MNPVALVEDEALHLGIPTFGLVTEVQTRIEQVADANVFGGDGSQGCRSFFYHNILLTLPAAVPCRHYAGQDCGIRFGLSLWWGQALASVPFRSSATSRKTQWRD